MTTLPAASAVHALIALMSLTALTVAQTGPSWQHELRGPGPGPNFAGGLAIGPMGEVYAAFSSSGAGGTVSDPQLDAVIRKYDASGALLWSRTIDLGADETAASVHFDGASGALYAVGGSTPMTGTAALPRPWYVWRLDPQTGAVRWTRTVTGSAGSGGGTRGATIDASGGLVVGGFLYPGSTSESDAALVRFAPDGSSTYTWAPAGPSSTFDSVLSAPAAVPGGGVVLSVEEAGHFWLHRLDATGVPVWSVQGATAFGAPRVDGASNVVTWSRRGGSSWLEKRDAQGNLVFALDDFALHGVASSILWFDVDAQGFVHVLSESMRAARVSPTGQVLWNEGLPGAESLEAGVARGIVIAPNGDSVALGEGFVPAGLEFISIARWDVNGAFRWSQGLLGTTGGTFHNASDVAVAPSGAVLVSGTFQDPGPGLSSRAIVAGLFEQSAKLCAGDGSAGPCPCGNVSTSGLGGGCASSPFGLGGGRLEDFGVASLTEDTLRLVGQGVGSLGPAILVQAAAAQGASPLGDGLLCLGAPLRRLFVATPTGSGVVLPAPGSESFSARSALLGDSIAAGTSRFYQLYFRTSISVCGGTAASLTNAVRVTWSP